MDRRDGLFPVYWDAGAGKVWLEIPAMEQDFLYVNSLAAGLGSNDIGLDRSQLGGTRLVRFERVGPKVLMVQPNLDYRAATDNPAEEPAVREAFAEGVTWGFTASAETDGRTLIDVTDFLVRDAHGVAQTLRASGEGTFSLDKSRSAPVPAMLKAFPRNTELEARLTFTGDNPGREVRSVAADPNAVTVRIRHSFVALPEPGYEPRAFDPRAGYFPLTYADYAAPIGEDTRQRLLTRHRLECATPPDASGLCDVKEPIVYYLDPGTPEPVRGALLDGARWWAEAFEAAGFRDGYRVEVRPDSIDPLDARYSTIQWVHRSTRGWSYGASVVDPRTGEIIKGHVSLGSLRVRQDYLIAEGLLAPYAGADAGGFAQEADDPMLQLALARIRQLSAHEVGHTIGLAHNFAASAVGRESVMDYPAPLATVAGSGIDVGDAYGVGLGAWDVQAVRYGYTPEASELEQILRENQDRGLLYITDYDARPSGAASPVAALWDNGSDAVQSLRDEMAVRRIALDRFSEATIRDGRPLATLEEVLVPLYLRHRYQVEATAHLVGGVSYAYSARGDGAAAPEAVPGAVQREALDALLATLAPSELALPPAALQLIPPRPPGYYDGRERFDRRTGVTLDPIAPAETAANMVLSFLLDRERAARLVYQHDLDASQPGLRDIFARTQEALAAMPASGAYEQEIRRTVHTAWTQALMGLAADRSAAPAVRARTEAALRDLHGRYAAASGGSEDAAHAAWLAADIERFLDRDYDPEMAPRPVRTPPGSPIGD
ncbi:hypothetical protein BSZ36_01495 [Rubricoccus marinus]|uniref:Peptidase n=2 Tax=Rubricoccus marinus TaxID=716817 RepID=A0A259U3K8_9BACT|nr:hypothetical protein BSZ36_01495 [Rubricoccus marinus]